MKMTMKELAKKYYWMALADLWDELSEKYPPEMTEEEFANEYNVDVAEVVEYFL